MKQRRFENLADYVDECMHEWLVKQSSPSKVKAPSLDKKLPDAPGAYVLQK